MLSLQYSRYNVLFSTQMFKSKLAKFRQLEPDGSADCLSNKSMIVTEQTLADSKDRTNRNLRTRELILERSSAAALIVV